MLRCSCKIIKLFAIGTTKTSLVFRYNSVSRLHLGCSCHLTKSVFAQSLRSTQFRKSLEATKTVYKEFQKKFICTSFLFMKNDDPKIISEELKSNIVKNKEEEDEELVNGTSTVQKLSASGELKSFNKIPKDQVKVIVDETLKEDEENIPIKTKPLEIPIAGGKIIDKLKNPSIQQVIDESKETLQKNFNEKKISENIHSVMKTPTKPANILMEASLINPVLPQDSVAVTRAPMMKPDDSKKVLADKKSLCNYEENEKKNEEGRKVTLINLGEVPANIENPVAEETGKVRTAVENVLPKETQSILIEKAKTILFKTLKDDNRVVKVVPLGGPKGDISVPSNVRRRQTVDLNRSSTERNFITPVRAMTDFLLKPSDLEGLRKTKRRSPYENDPPITVYWRKDVESKALEIWGSKENLLKEILKRDIERRRYQQNIFTVKRRLRDYRREQGRETEFRIDNHGLFGTSGKVVITAIAINASNFLLKLIAWALTGSHSMFSETVHSLADTINQLILAYGIHKSVQRADSDHPYGYTNMRYVASLISGVGIFCVGSGLSFYHGIIGLTDPTDTPSFYVAFLMLGVSLISEGATLLMAVYSIRRGAKNNQMTFSEYVLRGQDPSVNVVLLEDLAAVVGVVIAFTCTGLSSYYCSRIPDAIGSLLVGGLLAAVASFIIYTNVAALVGRSIPQERLDKINSELEADVMIRAIHDVKGIDMGNSLVRYKAELDFDGGELTRSYLDKQDLNQMLEEVKKMQTIDELEEFMLKHGENIVDMMGGEIDRIELKLRKKHPEIRHCDLEIL